MGTQVKTSSLLAILSLASFLPHVRADCWTDFDGFEHCSLGDSARVGIAIAIIVVALLFIASAFTYKRRRARATLLITQVPQPGAVNNQNVAYGGYPGFNTQSGYYPNAPLQYPPQPYGGYTPQGTFAPPPGPAPPAYYEPPQGPPPAVLKSDV